MLLQEISQILAAARNIYASQEEQILNNNQEHIYILGSDRRETIP
jgi:hypothetical protein